MVYKDRFDTWIDFTIITSKWQSPWKIWLWDFHRLNIWVRKLQISEFSLMTFLTSLRVRFLCFSIFLIFSYSIFLALLTLLASSSAILWSRSLFWAAFFSYNITNRKRKSICHKVGPVYCDNNSLHSFAKDKKLCEDITTCDIMPNPPSLKKEVINNWGWQFTWIDINKSKNSSQFQQILERTRGYFKST